jgi:hypothetical protein
VPPNLVNKGFQQDTLGAGLHVHGPEGWAHPPDAGGREKGEAAGSSGQCVLCLLSLCWSVWSPLLGFCRTLPETNTMMTCGLEVAWEPP